MLADEFDNFKLINKEDCAKYSERLTSIEAVFQAYILDDNVRNAIDNKRYASLMTTPIANDIRNLANITFKGRTILDYIVDYVAESDVSCDQFR